VGATLTRCRAIETGPWQFQATQFYTQNTTGYVPWAPLNPGASPLLISGTATFDSVTTSR